MEKKIIATKDAPAAVGPYSQAVVYGDLFFCAGQIGLDPVSGLLPDSLEAQTRQIFKNLKAVLQEAEMSLDNVLQATLYLVSMKDFDLVNRVYAEHFSEPYPARVAVEVSALPKAALVEIAVVAGR